ncbi:MAG: amino acid adenylation domain-containing protein [Lutisporaceae bacterium]
MHSSLQGKINNIAKEFPDKIAIECGSRKLSYLELENASNSIAAFLSGIKSANNNILMLMEKSEYLVESILSTIKAGFVFVPLDPKFPVSRLSIMADISDSKWIVTQSKWLYKANELAKTLNKNLNVILIGESKKEDIKFEKLSINEIENYYTNSIEASDQILNKNCYIYFTSGSTGKPKGVWGRHRSLKHFVEWEIEEFCINSNFKISQLTSPSFDPFLRDIFVPLCSGGTLCIPEDDEIILNPRMLVKWIDENQINLIHIVPSLLKQITEVIEDSNCLNSLKYILLAGELLRGNDIKQFIQMFGSRIQLVNLYGPTETTLAKFFYRVSESDIGRAIIPVGKPINSTNALILNNEMAKCRTGSIGEIYIRTPFISSGYYKEPSMTKEVFLLNPFSDNSQDIIYKTGDLGRILPDGNMEVVGRIDHQVKIRGFRIEIGEIENRLLNHKAIKEAAIIAKEDNTGSKYLCAYIVSDIKLTVSELRDYLSEDLPEYMLPSYFILLDKLPLTLNGKVDRKALYNSTLSEFGTSMTVGTEYEAPRNNIEEALAAIWKEILGVEKIGINDNFFELGGHSLKAISLGAKIHKVLNVEISLKEIFTNPTIKGISECIKGSKESLYSSIEPAEGKGYYEMSSAQKRIYTLQQLELNSTSYNMPKVFELEGDLDTVQLKEAFSKLIQRHEALRTSFEVVEEGLIQKVHKEIEFEIEEYLAIEDKEIEVIIEGFIRAFDLSKAPLLRVGLIVRTAHPNKHILMLDMHHIISDGTSIGIMVEEFSKTYAGEELTPLRIQYKDFSEWQNELFRSDSIKAQEEYWLKQFEGEIPVLNLTTDYQRPAIQSFEGASIQFKIEEELTNKLRQIAKATGSTMYMVLLSTLNILLSKYSGQADIIVGSPIAGRPHADLENIIGMFVNTLAMRNYPSGEKTFEEFLMEVKENALGAYAAQDYQFEELVEKLNIARDFSRNPVFDVMLVLQNMDRGEAAVEGISIKPYKSENRISKFDMIMNAVEIGNNICISIQYCTKLFNKATIERMYKHLENIMQAITENIDTKLSEIEILTEKERQQILIDFNNTKATYPKDKTIHQLFEEQVERTPAAVAAVYDKKSLTYKELDIKANQLARTLRNKGVKADSIVGLMVERSLEMLVGILGILKAGGAYLPIDPEYPSDRIAYMLEDSNANIMLTQTGLVEKVDFNGITVLLDSEEAYHEDGSKLENINKSEDLLYVIYTSGSTGKPKGVLLEHGNICNLINFEYEKTNINFNTRVLQFTSISFDVCYQEIFSTLLCGGGLYLIDNETKKNADKLLKFIDENEIEVVFMATAYFKYIVSQPDYINALSEKIKHIVVAGEQLLVADKLKQYILNTNVNLHNHYGPSETHVVTTYTISSNNNIEQLPPIGKPISNTKIYIMNKYKKLQPVGVVGELCIAGDCVGRSYLNRPELTADKFIDNPFEPGTRMYKTGDLTRWLPDGNIEFLGRIDNQVKIRGFRIELGEIENKILQHEAVKEAAVIVRENKENEKYICAYVVSEKKLDELNLNGHLKESLPLYMIPTYFVKLDKMPLTTNGKLDRRKLPEPDLNTILNEYEAPRNETEEKLVQIWEEVLKIDKIGISDNFFELGGHSIKAMKLIAKIRYIFNVEMALNEVFKFPTIKKIAVYIENARDKGCTLDDNNIVLLNRGQNGNLFFIHAIFGNIEQYIEFCHLLETNINCWGIRPDKLQNYFPVLTTMETLAAKYIEKMKCICPQGPYNIVGWSIGGVIAYEIVRQLEQAGEKVGYFAIVDTQSPCTELIPKEKLSPFSIDEELERIRQCFGDSQLISDLEAVSDKSQIWNMTLKWAETAGDIKEKLINSAGKEVPPKLMNPLFQDSSIRDIVYKMNMLRSLFRDLHYYIPSGKIASQVYFFKATESNADVLNLDGWRSLCEKPIKLYDIEGEHVSIFRQPNIVKFAKIFKETLSTLERS